MNLTLYDCKHAKTSLLRRYFTSLRTAVDEGYGNMADNMVALAEQQPGYLGHESARDGTGITVSYWQSLEAISNWKKTATI